MQERSIGEPKQRGPGSSSELSIIHNSCSVTVNHASISCSQASPLGVTVIPPLPRTLINPLAPLERRQISLFHPVFLKLSASFKFFTPKPVSASRC